jgi:DNA-binding NarL/FixJ family response regulator
MPHPRILIIEDQPLMADAIAVSVQSCLPLAQCHIATALSSAVCLLSSTETWALVLLDLNLPDAQWLHTLNAVCELRPQGALLVLSTSQDPCIEAACLASGVTFVNKALPSSAFMSALLSAMYQVLSVPLSVNIQESKSLYDRFQSLTTQQRLVLAQLSKGWTSRRIAQHLRLSEATVRSHTREVLRKLGVDNRTEATHRYLQWIQQQVSDV